MRPAYGACKWFNSRELGSRVSNHRSLYSRPQRPRSFWSAPRIATSGEGQSWKTTAHASLATQSAVSSAVSRRVSARKSRLKQQIPNVKSITERWRYFVDFLHDFESFYFPKRFIYLHGIAFSGPYHWNFRKARDFVYFIDPSLCIVASRAAFSRHGLLTSR